MTPPSWNPTAEVVYTDAGTWGIRLGWDLGGAPHCDVVVDLQVCGGVWVPVLHSTAARGDEVVGGAWPLIPGPIDGVVRLDVYSGPVPAPRIHTPEAWRAAFATGANQYCVEIPFTIRALGEGVVR